MAHAEFNIFDLRCQIDILGTFLVDALLDFRIFFDVALLKLLQVGQLTYERIKLSFELGDFALTIRGLLLQRLQLT